MLPYQSLDDDQLGSPAASRKTYTVEDAVEHMGFGRFQLKVFFICGLFSATDALEMLMLSVLSPVLRCDWLLSEWQVALITTVVFIGMFSGSNMWGSWADKYGRLTIMMIASVWICYFGIMTAFSPNYVWILILRCLVGMGFGGAIQSFTYSSEFLPTKVRAKVLIIGNFMWALGSIFEVFMADLILPTWGWRWLVAISALPTFITMFFLWTLPESARYLMAAGEREKALKVLEDACKANGKSLPEGTLVSSPPIKRGRFKDLFSSELRRTTLQTWLLWFGAASSYYGIILAQSEILERGNVCQRNSMEERTCHCNPLTASDYHSMIYATLGEFVVIPINLITIDWFGRRWTITINFLFTAFFFLLVQICTSRALLTVFIFGVRTFASGIFNTVYIYTSEVFPTVVRSLGLGSCSAMARVGAMITPFVAQVLMEWSMTTALWMYGGLCIACALTSFMLPIETKGRELAQGKNNS
ncbi:hypothetical protein CAPTEDRAFT_170750 [Capitella teleta]|uniref:Major facilitator superfamily (MFS) profile domain-containing protein n=1 Tax=Capitella teleta TaxID=283909 RepID=R7UGK5_CAPTE|nr:hypothetical protein CAPTEDRAFT_170750 [Capitella teleta]|eukprot:ELU05355.1 hypothetical protein CAPTEDRAFT_170750 [Capitella teleta]